MDYKVVVIVYENSDVSAGEIIEFALESWRAIRSQSKSSSLKRFRYSPPARFYKRVLKEELEKIVNGKS